MTLSYNNQMAFKTFITKHVGKNVSQVQEVLLIYTLKHAPCDNFNKVAKELSHTLKRPIYAKTVSDNVKKMQSVFTATFRATDPSSVESWDLNFCDSTGKPSREKKQDFERYIKAFRGEG